MFTLNQQIATFPQYLYLTLSAQTQADAEQHIKHYSHDIARRNAYINYLCLYSFLDWLSEEPDLRSQNPQIFPDQPSLPSIWSMVNGIAIQLGETRLVLIPSETNPLDELVVPWEWVDIPSWAADYYLAVQMNLESDECWMQIRGFTTYEKLKQGRINSLERTYSVADRDLTASLNIMWIAQEVCPPSKPTVASLPSLTARQLEQLIAHLGTPTPYSPRLEAPFPQWGKLLESDRWRQTLYERREQDNATRSLINLRRWLQNVSEPIEEVWSTVESLLAPMQPIPVRGQTETQTANWDTIAPVIRLIQTGSSEQIRRQAAGVLGEIGAGYPEAIESLVELIKTAKEEETRWQAALSLGKIAPHHPWSGIRKGKIVDLGIQLEDCAVALVVASAPKTAQRIGVFLQLRPVGKLDRLPGNLKITVLGESGEIRQEAIARCDSQGQGKDKSLELRFSPPPGAYFQVQVTLNNITVVENFIA